MLPIQNGASFYRHVWFQTNSLDWHIQEKKKTKKLSVLAVSVSYNNQQSLLLQMGKV